MKIKKNSYSIKQILTMLGCKHCKRFPLFGDIDTSLCDCILRTYDYLHHIVKRGNIVILLSCDKENNFCYYVSVGVL